MCLAVPLRIESIDGLDAVGEFDGVRRKLRLDFAKNASVGDFVLVHAGFAIEKIEKEQAELDRAAFMELMR